MCKILFSPWEEVRGSVEDFMAGLGGLVSATQALHTKKSTKLKKNIVISNHAKYNFIILF